MGILRWCSTTACSSLKGSVPDVATPRAYHQMEIHFGKFLTAVGIPGPIDLDHAEAEYKDGFLTVRMPKAQDESTSRSRDDACLSLANKHGRAL